MALLYESSLDGKRRLWNSLLIYIDGKHDNKGKRAQEERGEAGEYPLGALFARWFISFTMARLSSNEAIVAEGCTELARLLAQEEVTKTMEAAPDRDMQGPFWKEAVKAAKRVLPRVGVAFWDCRPDFASAVERSKDPRDKMDKRESIWFTAVLSYCHDLVLLEDLSPEQACIVD
jgi:hypothetical protein